MKELQEKISIKEIIANSSLFVENTLSINGWIKEIRNGKNNFFIFVNDGSCFESIQIFFSSKFTQKEILDKLKFGSWIEIKGLMKLTPNRQQKFEIIAEEITNFSLITEEYPLQKKNLPLSYVRNYPQFKSRTNHFLAIFRIRSIISKLINKFFEENNFFYINTPILTSNDAEGAGEIFVVNNLKEKNFFNKQCNLTVSGQLHAEVLAQGLGKVYNFSPCFRAEKSNTTRHLSEFWMIEAEIAFGDLKQIIEISENLIKYVINGVLKESKAELIYLNEKKEKTLIKNLEDILNQKFIRANYSECIEILSKSFDKDEIKWGMNFGSEHEKYIANHFKSPVFITDYPAGLKAFYMKKNDDKETVSCMDLVFPSIGEMIGGSVRENRYEEIMKSAEQKNINIKDLNWYFEMRRNGYAQSAGFGIGLERLIMLISGTENIRDVISFPRSFKELDF